MAEDNKPINCSKWSMGGKRHRHWYVDSNPWQIEFEGPFPVTGTNRPISPAEYLHTKMIHPKELLSGHMVAQLLHEYLQQVVKQFGTYDFHKLANDNISTFIQICEMSNSDNEKIVKIAYIQGCKDMLNILTNQQT